MRERIQRHAIIASLFTAWLMSIDIHALTVATPSNWTFSSTAQEPTLQFPKLLLHHKNRRYQKDLAGILSSHVIRVALPASEVDFRIREGRQEGLAQSLARLLGEDLHVRTELVVVDDNALMWKTIQHGLADVVIQSDCRFLDDMRGLQLNRKRIRKTNVCWGTSLERPRWTDHVTHFFQDQNHQSVLAALAITNSTQLFHRRRGTTTTHLNPISKYDPLFQKAAAQYDLDWRLLAALAFQESRLDHTAISPNGAYGLMQLIPETAQRFGVQDIGDPQASVEGATRYLKYTMKVFSRPGIAFRDRIRFALAAYNAGLGHVFDARKLASELGLNPNRWFGHVEKAMLLLTKRRYHQHARFGRARGYEVTRYVSEIQSRYDAYVMYTDKGIYALPSQLAQSN